MASTIAQLLKYERGAGFTGRQAEIALFHELLNENNPQPRYLMHLYGPGGQGKTTLLEKFRHLCDVEGIFHLNVDGQETPPTPADFFQALISQLPTGSDGDFFAWLSTAATQPLVIFIDNYEMLESMEGWLYREFLPRLHERTRIVLSGRRAPSTSLVADAGWRKLMYSHRLPDFTAEEADDYLTRRGVPAVFFEKIQSFAHGHPLTLSLVADAVLLHPAQRFDEAGAAALLRRVYARLVQEAGSDSRRMALEVSALARFTTESLLHEVLPAGEAGPCFDWLRRQPFVEENRHGLRPSTLARESVLAELRWRNAERF